MGYTIQDSRWISIHALREEGDLDYSFWSKLRRISIHALREEGDHQSGHLSARLPISIHALREEGDARIRAAKRRRMISIHALREEGDAHAAVRIDRLLRFLSTPSARRATSNSGRIPDSLENFYPRPPRGGRQ